MYTYITKGVCSRKISFDVKDNKIFNVLFTGGCNGNLQGISRLVEGMDINDVSKKLKGISCGGKGTSCPDQLAAAIQELILKNHA
ncbi:TIGR03905 family TSCPD domain-containing protein [Clostridium sp. JN-1]|jgi:uncharacterized protein (TIGR03905 family)|uniref:TIGR03905 family TSCPD domain-containing protein n=1 Tax=Clostridium sp. JN-1 TaxID=2483110 RepID=UPI000F0B5F1D|nr:TIGR03905 family TSCPD domain-containing protein [Clostridium sp. JN-1]